MIVARSTGAGVRAKRAAGGGPRPTSRGKPARPASGTGRRGADKQRQAIERAAARVFASHGYRGATMREVAARVGCSVGQIYNHYPDKLELYRAIIESKCRLLGNLAQEILDSTPSPEERLRRTILLHLEFFQSHMAFFRIIALETGPLLFRGNHHFLECVGRWRTWILDQIIDAIQQGQTRGDFRTELDSQLAAVSLVSLLKGHMGDFILHPRGSLVDRADAILDLFFAGMRRGRTA